MSEKISKLLKNDLGKHSHLSTFHPKSFKLCKDIYSKLFWALAPRYVISCFTKENFVYSKLP